MSCYLCADKFTLFNKQHGCKQCGFAFCGKCVSKKAPVPKLQNQISKVCNQCFLLLTKPASVKSSENPWDLPENFKRRLVTSQSSAQGFRDQPAGKPDRPKSTSIDVNLQSRLQTLKSVPAVGDEEIRARLAKLKDIPSDQPAAMKPPSEGNSHYYQPPPKSQQEQIDALMKQNMEENALDRNYAGENVTENPLSEDDINSLIESVTAELQLEKGQDKANEAAELQLRERLSALKVGRDCLNGRDWIPTRPLTAEEEAAEIAARCILENKLEGKTQSNQSSLYPALPQLLNDAKTKEDSVDEDCPWCCMCNDNAQLRCPQCENDLYCTACSVRAHKIPGFEDHKPVSFQVIKL